MGKALYRAYRSTALTEIVGQEHITEALQRALERGTISHAYLFTGPRGVGKTSIARILAHAVNDLPYETEGQHLDIIEIDAASNNGVEDVRDLRDKVHVAPTSNKYKVYIIDEVHMLSKAAFNALLKTLEEPPEHVIFILATTELHKVPDTIISRTQRYTFRPVRREKVIAHLRHIAESEGLKVSDDALALIADHGNGSFRDSIGLLDQVRLHDEEISLAHVEQLLGRASADGIDQLLRFVQDGQAADLIKQLDSLRDQGISPSQTAAQLMDVLRRSVLDGAPVLPAAQLLPLLDGLSTVAASSDARTALEVRLLEQAFAGSSAPATPRSTPPRQSSPRPAEPAPKPPEPKPVAAPASPPQTAQPKTAEKSAPVEQIAEADQQSTMAAPSTDYVMTAGQWQSVLDAIRGTYNTLYGIMRMAQPQYEPGLVRLVFRHGFHQKRVSDAKNRGYILDAIASVCGVGLQLECIVGEAEETPAPAEKIITENLSAPVSQPTPTPSPEAPAPSLANISNIFGGAEVLDS